MAADKTLMDLIQEVAPGITVNEINRIVEDADRFEERIREMVPDFVSFDDIESQILLDQFAQMELHLPGGYKELMEGMHFRLANGRLKVRLGVLQQQAKAIAAEFPATQHASKGPTIELVDARPRMELASALKATDGFRVKAFTTFAGIKDNQWKEWRRNQAHIDGNRVDRMIRTAAARWFTGSR
jgi:hypothetical protein